MCPATYIGRTNRSNFTKIIFSRRPIFSTESDRSLIIKKELEKLQISHSNIPLRHGLVLDLNYESLSKIKLTLAQNSASSLVPGFHHR